MARRADVARGTRTDATQQARPRGRATRAHARHRWRMGGADTWKWPRESTRTPEGAPRGRVGAGIWRAHGLVGPG